VNSGNFVLLVSFVVQEISEIDAAVPELAVGLQTAVVAGKELAVVEQIAGIAVVEQTVGTAVVEQIAGIAVVEQTVGIAVVEQIAGIAVVEQTVGIAVVEQIVGIVAAK